jgi:hypothetical protein
MGEQGLEFDGFGDFGFVGRGAEDVHGFDDFFVEFEPFAVARGGLLERAVDDGGDAVKRDDAAFEVIAVNSTEDVFGGDEGEGVGLGGGAHSDMDDKRGSSELEVRSWEEQLLGKQEGRKRRRTLQIIHCKFGISNCGDGLAILGSDTLGF